MNYAVIKDNIVVALIDGDATLLGSISPGTQIQPISDGTTVAIGDVFINGGFETPAPATVMSKRDFMTRFEQAEAVGILQAAATDPVIQYAQTLMQVSDAIDVADPYCIQYVGYLVIQGLLTQARADVILAPAAAA